MAVGYQGAPKKPRATQWHEISYMTTPAKRRERTHQRQVTQGVLPPPFISMDPGGINLNTYNPNAPAKVRERKINQRAKNRRRATYQGGVESPPRHTGYYTPVMPKFRPGG